MFHWKSSLCLVVSTLAVGWAASASAQVTQNVTYIDWSSDCGLGAIFISDSGTVAGSYNPCPDDFSSVFIQQANGATTTFDAPDSIVTLLAGMNGAGTMVGSDIYSGGDDGPYEGFLLDSSGRYTAFKVGNAYYVSPAAISSSGAVVGTYQAFDDKNQLYSRSFIRSASGAITTFDSPGEPTDGEDVGPTGVNDSGIIIGTYYDPHSTVSHGYIRTVDGKIKALEIPGGTVIYLSAINNKGDIAGYATIGGSSVAFIRGVSGKFTILPTLYPQSMNQAGDLCGLDVNNHTVIRYSDGKVSTVSVPFDQDSNYGCSSINSSRTMAGGAGSYDGWYISQPLAAIDFSTGFSTASDSLNLTGSAAVNGSQLMLTNGKDSEASSAFYGYPVDIRSFTTDFTFVPSDAVADGLTFTIQNDDPSAVGFPGAGLGYQRIDKSVALKFDFHNNFGEGSDSTGLYLNGVSPTIPAVDLSQSGINLTSGDPIKVHVTYDSATNGGDLTLTLTDETNMHTWTKSFTVDIPTTVGATTAYVGFTASTGEKTSNLAIASWNYQAATSTP